MDSKGNVSGLGFPALSRLAQIQGHPHRGAEQRAPYSYTIVSSIYSAESSGLTKEITPGPSNFIRPRTRTSALNSRLYRQR